jgi:hypothetical protein
MPGAILARGTTAATPAATEAGTTPLLTRAVRVGPGEGASQAVATVIERTWGWGLPWELESVLVMVQGSSGDLVVHDPGAPGVAAALGNQKFRMAYAQLTAGAVVQPQARGAMAFRGRPLAATVPAGAPDYWFNVVLDAAADGARYPEYWRRDLRDRAASQVFTATGVALLRNTFVDDIEILEPGTAGQLEIYEGCANNAAALRWPVAAFGALARGQRIRFCGPQAYAAFAAMYLVLPTGAAVRVNHLPC